MRVKKISLVLILTIFIQTIYSQNLTLQADSTFTEKNRMEWYKEARFGLFIHWGAYSQLDGEYKGKTQKDPKGEWIMRNLRIPVDEYATEISGKFNPSLFDADKWVKTAKEAGIKYLVITTKHHDGFSLFDSSVSDYNIVDSSPFGRDVIREIADACKKYGLRLGVYYSQAQDWYHPGGYIASKRWDKKQEGDWDNYFESIAKPQVRELLDNYSPVSLIWFDSKRATVNMELAKDFEKELRKEYPNLILNPRLHKGDFKTFEQVIPGILDDEYNELCITHNRSWSFKSSDTEWKKPQFLLKTFIQMVSKGGNFLFNVGPSPDGEFPNESITTLNYIGDWMEANSESIYGTSQSPFYKLDFGTATVKRTNGKTKLYLHVFDWPENQEIFIEGINNNITTSYLLDGRKTLSVEKLQSGIRIMGLPKEPKHEVASVIVIEIDEIPKIDPGYIEFENDTIELLSKDALLTIKPQFDHIPKVVENENFSYFDNWKNRYPHPRFKNTGNKAHWKIIVPETGDYHVWLNCSTQSSSNIVSIVGNGKLKTTLPNTGGMDNFENVYLGKLKLDKGLQTVTFTGGKKMEVWDYVNVGKITLKINK